MSLNGFTSTSIKMLALEICDLRDYLAENDIKDPKLVVAAIEAFGRVRAGEAIASAISNAPENFTHEIALLLKHLGWSDRIPVDISGLGKDD